MVTYKKDRTGVKIKTGSMLNPFDPVLATLPDLSTLNSKTYVSEIDINKIKPGQAAEISIDAFKGKSFTGKIFSIANIGETLSNSDSKVFEVQIRMDGTDPSLKPSMTTGNKIIIDTFDNVVFVPLEAVHAGPDSIPFVYTKKGEKQIVLVGLSNDKNIIIEKGLDPETPVYLTRPEKYEKFSFAGDDLIPIIRERNNAKRVESDRTMKNQRTLPALRKYYLLLNSLLKKDFLVFTGFLISLVMRGFSFSKISMNLSKMDSSLKSGQSSAPDNSAGSSGKDLNS